VRDRVAKTLAGRPPAGKTALFDGIAKALEDPVVDAIVVLSDGAPSAGSWFTKTDVREELAKANRWRRARIDVISVGTDEVAKRWRSLLRDLAEDHGGRCLGP
jgi:Mg-chelatase subunit ChlD